MTDDAPDLVARRRKAASLPLRGVPVVVIDHGPLEQSRGHPAWFTSLLLLMPAAILVGLLLMVPVAAVLWSGLLDRPGDAWGAVVVDESRAFWLTSLWAVVLPLVVTGLGLGFSILARRGALGGLVTWVLLAPFAFPAVVTAVTFGFVYDPDPGSGAATAVVDAIPGVSSPDWLGSPGWANFALMSAFVWSWVGLAVVVFRLALNEVPQTTVDGARSRGAGRLQILWHVFVPWLRRPGAMVVALVALAGVRVFDLVMVMIPEETRESSAVLAVRMWQTEGADDALGAAWLLLVLLVAGVALALHSRSPSPSDLWAGDVPEARPPDERRSTSDRGRRRQVLVRWLRADGLPPIDWAFKPSLRWRKLLAGGRRVGGVVVVGVWVLPVLALVMTAFSVPASPAGEGWWRLGDLGLGSFGHAVGSLPLLRSLVLTGIVAAVVTVVVILVAAPAAHALARGGSRWETGVSAFLLVAAIVPVLAVRRPLQAVLDGADLGGTVLGLVLVHVAVGLPFAVLVLRNAMDTLPAGEVRRLRIAQGGRYRLGVELRVLWRLCGGRAGPKGAGSDRRSRVDVVPALVSVAVLEFILVWNDFVVALLFGGPEMLPGAGSAVTGGGGPVSLLLYDQAPSWVAVGEPLTGGSLAGAATLMAAVPVVLVLACWRRVIAGLVPGTRP